MQDLQGNPYPKRELYCSLQSSLQDFLAKKNTPRWITIPGLRGVGKTTLLSHLYLNLLPKIKPERLFGRGSTN